MEKMKNTKIVGWAAVSIFILFVISTIIYVPPSRATVENYLSEKSCNPTLTKTTMDIEYSCAARLRRTSALWLGNIYDAGFPFFARTPFHYFNYHESLSDSHTYVMVDTSDYGVLAYNPVNGKYIGVVDELLDKQDAMLQSS
jgi:hypothetical protein